MSYTDKILNRIKSKIKFEYQKNRIENTLCLVSTMAEIEYLYNQKYRDDYLEDILTEIAALSGVEITHKENNNCVLFYDGFGLDERGLAQIYLKALVNNGYKVIYVTQAASSKMQRQIMSIVNCKDNVIYHNSNHKMTEKIKWLDGIFKRHSFSTAFFYTTPWDVSGTIAFEHLAGKCIRFQINLTDHAFWLGVNAFDYSLEFRNYGAAISRDYRGISEEKLLYLPYYPIINHNIAFQGFPFNAKGKKVIFSGGSIYKTIDKYDTYYILVDRILSENDDVVFVFASSETSKQLNALEYKYPNRVIHIDERKDLIRVLENSYLYLNTYPISGALMLQYAAVAGCIPVTLRRSWDDDALGILIAEERLGEIFDDFDSVLEEINKLLSDIGYYNKKKSLLKGQVISESDFQNELNEIIANPDSRKFKGINPVDTQMFKNSYKDNMTEIKIVNAIISKKSIKNVFLFPDMFIKKILYKFKLID